jgi:hypothetical protein
MSRQVLRRPDSGPVLLKPRRGVKYTLWDNVTQSGPECWPYTGHVNKQGYGIFRHEGKYVTAHRLASELTNGPIPPGLVIDHRCHNQDPTCTDGKTCLHRRCCNPEHLEAVTQAENVRRSHLHSGARTECPEGHPYSGDNLRTGKNGARFCRTCDNGRDRSTRYQNFG